MERARDDRERDRSRSREHRKHRSSGRRERSRSRSRSAPREDGREHKRHRSRHHRDRSPSSDGSSRGHRRHRRRDDEGRRDDHRSRHGKHGRSSRSPSPEGARVPAAAHAATAATRSAAPDPPAAAAGGSKKESSARIAELFGYTAENNPFGDSNLHDTFVWRKKIQREVETGVRTAAPTKAEHRRERDNLMTEIERARERRVQREREREETERLRAEEARLKDAEQYHNWEAKEEEFHLAQVRQRSIIRMREARERPVDILAKNILLIEMCEKGEDADDANRLVAMDVELNEPGVVLEALPLAELEALLVDVERFIVLEGDDGRYRRFWAALRIVTVDLIERAMVRAAAESAADAAATAPPGGAAAAPALARAAANEAIEREIDAMFEGKGEDVLGDMEESVRDTIRRGLGAGAGGGGGGGAAIDVDYWERVLRHLKAAQARQALRRMHEELLAVRLGQLERKRDELGAAGGGGDAPGGSAAAPAADAGALRSYSPSLEPDLLPAGSAEAGAAASEADSRADLLSRRLEALRRQGVLPPQAASLHERLNPAGPAAGDAVDEMMQPYLDSDGRALPLGLTELDMGGGAEVSVAIPALAAAALAEGAPAAPDGLSAPEALMWQEKWRPRKPRYFNRVRTGYDWNRYNQAHYDHDNPPPKTVQGYKFNIFYPDLLDRSRAPRYFLEPADSKEFAIIRFHAGPPYEDVAFKIVNREWEMQKKHGFRASFDRGTLQLHFNFKRMRYRK